MQIKSKTNTREPAQAPGTKAVPFWKRFSTLLNLYNFGVFSVLLIVVTYFAFRSGQQTIEQHVHNHLTSINLNKISQFEDWLRNNEETISAFAIRPTIQENVKSLLDCMAAGAECAPLENDLIKNRLMPFVESDLDFLALSVIRASDGLVVASTETSIVGKYREDEAFFIEGKTHTYTASSTYHLTEGAAVMHIGSPIFSPNGKLIAVLAAHANLDEMNQIIQQRSGLSASEETYLVNSFNYFVTEPFFGEGYTLKKSIYTDGVQDCLQGNSAVGFYDDYRGVGVIGVYNWLPAQQLCMLSEMDEQEAYAPINALRTRLIAFSLGLFAVSFAFGFAITRRISEPINQLHAGVKQIGAGNLAARVIVKTENEFSSLADAFNNMAGSLEHSLDQNQKLVEKLQSFNQELELRVDQRTAELKSAQLAALNIMQDLKKEAISRQQAQNDLAKQAANLERSNTDLQQFAYVASHDLQEPLRMVASYLQLLVRRYADRLDGDALEFINFAVDGAERMKALINDLLDYSRVGTRGKEFAPTDLNQVIGQVRVNLSSLIEENSALIANDELPTVMADQTQMIQLFQNLVANAIKFHGKQIPTVHISVKQDHDEWVFSVADNGIGIDPQYFERIFVIFQRLHSKSEYAGTGIGLAVSKRIVELHGGRIWVKSQPEKGTIFYFSLPVNKNEKKNEAAQ